MGLYSDKVVAFQGLGLWPTLGLCELRSARTHPDFQGMGINMTMKKLMIYLAGQKYGWPFVGFTERASGSRGILNKLGFKELSMGQVPSRLGDCCPPVNEFKGGDDQCFIRCQGDCGCQVYILKTTYEHY